MRRLGLIGGMSWESTVLYYQQLNEQVKARLGGLHSAPCLLHSVDFAVIAALQQAGQWDEAGRMLALAAGQLESIGAEAIVLCTNTMHKLAPAIEAALGIPLLHIIDGTAQAIQKQGMKKLLLLGTRYTMEEPFYRDFMRDRYGIEIVVPERAGRDGIHAMIYQELCLGRIVESSRDFGLGLIDTHRSQGAEGVILGCTELTLLLKPERSSLPLFDSAALHVQYAVDWALRGP